MASVCACLRADRDYDHDKYPRPTCRVETTSLIARRGEEHGSSPGMYRDTLVDHLPGLNRPLWCMMDATANEVASGELSVADCVNVVRHEKGHPGE